LICGAAHDLPGAQSTAKQAAGAARRCIGRPSAGPARAFNVPPVDVELEPEQPDEVARAVQELLAEGRPAPDPWWEAGIDDATGGLTGT